MTDLELLAQVIADLRASATKPETGNLKPEVPVQVSGLKSPPSPVSGLSSPVSALPIDPAIRMFAEQLKPAAIAPQSPPINI